MSSLINQLFDAIHIWSLKTESSDEGIRQYILIDIGPFDYDEDIEFNLSMVQKRLEVLVHEVHLSEQFLVAALIQDIEKIFENQLEDARKGENSREVARIREIKRKHREVASEQERQSQSFQRSMKRLDEFEQQNFSTPHKIALIQFFWDTWKEVTEPILQEMQTEN